MAEASDGTGAGMARFLDWAGERGEINRATAAAYKTAVAKVLAIEANPDVVDLRQLDVDDVLSRFETKNRANYGTKSMDTYLGRFRRAVAMYRAWLDKQSDWKSAGMASRAKSTRASRLGPVKQAPKATGKATNVVVTDSGFASDSLAVERSGTTMVPYDLPLRPGLRARLVLPEDLTKADADRIARFVGSLAFQPEPSANNSPSLNRSGAPSTLGGEG